MQRDRTALDGGPRTALARWGNPITGALIAAATFGLLWATLDDYGMAWDEGFTVEREERLREWFARVVDGQSTVRRAWTPTQSQLDRRSDYLDRAGPAADSPWSRESLRFYWQFAREEPSGHPPFYALLGLAGHALTYRFLPPLESYRVGPAALFALAIGAIYSLMARHYGPAAGLMASLGLLTMPRVFAHAHLASYDAPTLSLWFLAIFAFLRASGQPPLEPGSEQRLPVWGWTLALGVAWGCAAATKLTGWFLPIPMAAWAVFYRDRRAARALLAGGVIASAVILALIPNWWAHPLRGLLIFLESNLSRHRLAPIPTQFLGRVYGFSLPWYNTLVFTAILVPPATLALALVGIAWLLAGRFRDRVGTLLFLCWAFFMLLRSLRHAPGHDAERQFLASFAFLACLSGIGLAAVRTWLQRRTAPWVARTGLAAVLAVAVGCAAWSTWVYHPLQLSYFNVFIGGLSGASRAGMEPTYYWEAMTPDVRDWLRSHTEKDRVIMYDLPTMSFEYLQRWGLVPPSSQSSAVRAPRWYVVMNRPGHLKSAPASLGLFLLQHARPVFVKSVSVAPEVPLVAIFRGEDAYTAQGVRDRRQRVDAPPSAAPSGSSNQLPAPGSP